MMSARQGSSRGTTSLSAQQFREKIAQLLTAAGQQTAQQKTEYLNQYFSKWSMNQQRMTNQQFLGALQSLHLPLSGAAEVFTILDRDASGMVDIREFSDAMVSESPLVPMTKPRLATRSVGSEIVMSARQPAGVRYDRMGSMPAGTADRGYTPTHASSLQKTTNGSRTGSRSGSANRSPMVPSTPQPAYTQTVRPPIPSGTIKPRMSRAPTPAEVDFSDLVIAKFREIILSRGGCAGIHSLGRIFRIMDNDRNRRISLEELQYGLQDFGLLMGIKDLQLLLAAIDRDNTGAVSFEEFLLAVRGVVNPRRQALINMAFDVLDSSGDGQIQVTDLAANFDAQGHPDVMNGRLSEGQALAEFLSQFDGVDENGIVTRGEFMDYYRSISASIDDDDFFEAMLRNAWHLGGGSGQSQNSANTRLLVTLIDGTQRVVALQHDLGLDIRNANAVKAQLKAQGIVNVAGYSLGA